MKVIDLLAATRADASKGFVRDALAIVGPLLRTKDEALDDLVSRIRSSWYEAYNANYENYDYVYSVFSTYVIVSTSEGFTRYDYSLDAEGNITWGAAVDVIMSWAPATKDLNVKDRSVLITAVNEQLAGTNLWVQAIDPTRILAVDLKTGQPMRISYEAVEDTVRLGTPEPEVQPVLSDKYFGVRQAADGTWRWLSISSTTDKDSHGESFSGKALKESVEDIDNLIQAGTLSDRGPLRLCHHPAANVGRCTTQRFVDPYLIEAGMFDNTSVAQKAAQTLAADTSGKYGVSIGFLYAKDKLVDNEYLGGVRIFERSVTPRPANRSTSFVAYTGDTLFEEVLGLDTKQLEADLAEILGADTAGAIMTEGAEKLRSLQTMLNIKFKADEPVTEPVTEPVADVATETAPDFAAIKDALASVPAETRSAIIAALKVTGQLPADAVIEFDDGVREVEIDGRKVKVKIIGDAVAEDPMDARLKGIETMLQDLIAKPRDASYRPTVVTKDDSNANNKEDASIKQAQFFSGFPGGQPVTVVGGPANPSD